MTSQQREERNRLRIQAWEQRNHVSFQAKEQNLENVPLFGQPYKTNKEDKLSNRIQRMLGHFDDNTTTEPFIVPSSSTFPLTNSLHSTSDPLHKSPKGSSLRCDFNSPKCQNEDESQASSQDRQLIHSSLQKPPRHEKILAVDMQPLPFPHCAERHSLEAKEEPKTTSDETQYLGSSENTSGNNMQFSTKSISPQPNRTIIMSHSQAFNPPLSYKQTNAAMMQKPTAYVRPMDGPEVVIESPELRPSPEHCTRLPDVIPSKSIQGKASTLPHFLETLTSEIQCVERILNEMTCSWPPLLSGIHSPGAPKAQSSVKVTEEENGQISSDPPLSLQSSSVDAEAARECGTVSNTPKSEPMPVISPSEEWQLDKSIHYSQQNYRSKSQCAALQSPKRSLQKEGLQSSVGVCSSARDTSDLCSLNQRTVNFPTPQLPCAQENHGLQSIHKSSSTISPSEKPLHVVTVKSTLENRHGGVSVHFDQTSSQEEEPGLKEGSKVKTDRSHLKQCKNVSVVNTEATENNNNRDKDKKALMFDQCAACLNSNISPQSSFTDHLTPACGCCKSKTETKHKRESSLSQKVKHLHRFSHRVPCKDSLSLVVKINLNLLLKIPRTSETLEIHHCAKDDKPHQVTNGKKKDKGDQYCPTKKLKLQVNDLPLHTARLGNSSPSEATDKRSTKRERQTSLTSSAVRDCSQKSKKHKRYCGNGPQFTKEEVKCPNPKRNCGKVREESAVKKLIKESSSNRPLLKFEDRHYPVKHYIKEAKRLKHKADAEMDKLCKVFHYLNGALFFIESGIAMERDPQISMSSYTMFAETLELIKFVLKFTNSDDPTPTENDILALCLRCQALLQMAMFHHKQKTAISYSKTLIDHFNSSSQSPPGPSSFVKGKNIPTSPTNPLLSSGAVAGVNGTLGGSVVVPQDLGQVALTYVNITTLFLSAHDLWEQAEEFANKGSGLLMELNKAMGVLSLTSTMSSMVCYIRQGLHWLQMDCLQVK